MSHAQRTFLKIIEENPFVATLGDIAEYCCPTEMLIDEDEEIDVLL